MNAKELAKVPKGDVIQIRGHIVSYDTSKMLHRGGFPFLEFEVKEIVAWQKMPKLS